MLFFIYINVKTKYINFNNGQVSRKVTNIMSKFKTNIETEQPTVMVEKRTKEVITSDVERKQQEINDLFDSTPSTIEEQNELKVQLEQKLNEFKLLQQELCLVCKAIGVRPLGKYTLPRELAGTIVSFTNSYGLAVRGELTGFHKDSKVGIVANVHILGKRFMSVVGRVNLVSTPNVELYNETFDKYRTETVEIVTARKAAKLAVEKQ